MLGLDELLKLEEELREELNDHLEEILIRLNQKDKLTDLLLLLGMGDLLGLDEDEESMKDGKIVVIGQSDVEKEKLIAVAKSMGISKERFEFYLDYNDAKKFDFKKMQWSDKYSTILVGQMPHSGCAKGDYGSVIAALENQEGYPPVVRMGLNGLKLTKSAFKTSLEYLLNNGMIAA